MENNALKKFVAGLFGLLMILGVFTVAGVADDNLFIIDDVDYDDPVTPGEVMPVEITLENLAASNDVEDITVKLWIEDDSGDRIGDKISYEIKKIHQDSDKEFVLELPIPADAEEDDDYTLFVTAEGEWDNSGADVEAKWNSALEIEQEDDSLFIGTVQLSTNSVIAGETLDVAVGLVNNGKEDQSGIKVKVEIPEIGAEKTVALLNTLGAGYDYTAYVTLDIPEQADAGIYTFTAKVYNDRAADVYEKEFVVEPAKAVVVETAEGFEEVAITGAITQTIAAGKGSIFSIEVTNNENVLKTYDLVVGGVADWADARVDPAKLTLGPGDSEVVFVHILPTEAGEHAFTLFVKDNGAVIAANQVKVFVTGGFADGNSDLQNLFAVLVLVFIVVTAGYLYKKEMLNGEKGKQVYY